MRLVLVGPPGAGKGTQAAYLSQRFQIPHISTGEMLREQIRQNSSIGKQVDSFLAAGNLVPDALMFSMVVRRLEAGDALRGFILDGFPRSDPQAEALEGHLDRGRRPLNAVLQMSLSDEEIVFRLSHRRVCPTCGRSYHLKNAPPRQRDVCDSDGSPLQQREDDREEAIRNRLEVYHRQTEPVIEFYRQRGLLVPIDATGEVKSVQRQIEKSLEGRAA